MEKLSLQKEWDKRLKLRAESDKLWVESIKHHAEGNKLLAESATLHAEGDLSWVKAVLKKYGNIKLKWSNGDCTLENGEVYKNN